MKRKKKEGLKGYRFSFKFWIKKEEENKNFNFHSSFSCLIYSFSFDLGIQIRIEFFLPQTPVFTATRYRTNKKLYKTDTNGEKNI